MILQANVWKNETLNMAFLTRLFPSKATKYFFFLVSLVFNQQKIQKSHFPWVIRHKIHLFLQTFSEIFAVFAPKQDGARNRGRVYSRANWETSRTSISKRVLINQYQFFTCKVYHVESVLLQRQKATWFAVNFVFIFSYLVQISLVSLIWSSRRLRVSYA